MSVPSTPRVSVIEAAKVALNALSNDYETALETVGQINDDLGNAYKELKEAQELAAEHLATLKEVREERDAALAKAEEWRKMHSEALGETAKARDDLSIALRALDAWVRRAYVVAVKP